MITSICTIGTSHNVSDVGPVQSEATQKKMLLRNGTGGLKMDDFISREATIKRIKEVYCVSCNSYHGVRCRACGTGDAIDIIDDFPAADVAPVVHGRWIHSRYEDCSEQFELVKCSQCNHEAYAMAFYVRGGNYCPNCGAKMDGGDSDEDS